MNVNQLEALKMLGEDEEYNLFVNDELVHRGKISAIQAVLNIRPMNPNDRVSIRSDWDLSNAPEGLFDDE